MSCRKPSHEPQLVVSPTEAALGEIVTAAVINAPAGTRFSWQLPGFVNQAISDSSKASTTFVNLYNSSYDIRVRLYKDGELVPYTTFSRTITLKDEDYSLPPHPVTPTLSLTGDQLALTPCFFGDSSLSFIVSTGRSYHCLNAYIAAANSSTTNQMIKIAFNSVYIPNTCESGDVRAKSVLFTKTWYLDGEYPVEFTLNNRIFRGMLRVSKNMSRYEFIWPYTNDIIIEPKVLGKY